MTVEAGKLAGYRICYHMLCLLHRDLSQFAHPLKWYLHVQTKLQEPRVRRVGLIALTTRRHILGTPGSTCLRSHVMQAA
jgi:hypothetical protein